MKAVNVKARSRVRVCGCACGVTICMCLWMCTITGMHACTSAGANLEYAYGTKKRMDDKDDLTADRVSEQRAMNESATHDISMDP